MFAFVRKGEDWLQHCVPVVAFALKIKTDQDLDRPKRSGLQKSNLEEMNAWISVSQALTLILQKFLK